MEQYVFKPKTPAIEHHSFWLTPDTMRYIRTASRSTRIPQGQILQIMTDYFRLTRIKRARELTEAEQETFKAIQVFLRIIPL